MKKLISMLLCAALCLTLFSGCGSTNNPSGETTAVTEATASYESAQALLEAIYSGMSQTFPAAGGDEAHNAEGVGAYDIGAYGESFQYQILVDEELLDLVKPEAATLLHMMNTNTFCSAAMQLTDSKDAERFADHYKTLVQSHHWMCGFPETMLVLSLGDYVVTAYGLDDFIQSFKTSAQSLGMTVLVEAPAEG